jgi:hypothetical protein
MAGQVPIMPPQESPELVALFETYTASSTSIGAHLTRLATEAAAADPLIVATGTDMALFPGDNRPPTIQSFRLSTRGFKELAGVSHLGPALATLVNMRALAPDGELWRGDAERLLAAAIAAQAANSAALWRDTIAVAAYRGREQAIATMLDYALALTIRFLRASLADPAMLTGETLRAAFLEATDGALGATIPFNAVMIATFFLTALDIAHRVMDWFREQRIDWTRAMVLVCGQQGRPTAGVTWTTNSICQLILGASDHALPLRRMYIAPHAPSFTIADPNDPDAARALEQPLRAIWCYTKAIGDLAPTMFAGHPGYDPGAWEPPVITDSTTTLAEMPRILGPDDMRTMTARLRMVMEDPRQLLSGCVTDYAVEQLRRAGNDPSAVRIPGLDGYRYAAGSLL